MTGSSAGSVLVKPGELVLPPSMEMKEVEQASMFRVGELLPWKGIVLRVERLAQNSRGDFQVLLAPVGLTSRLEKSLRRSDVKAARR